MNRAPRGSSTLFCMFTQWSLRQLLSAGDSAGTMSRKESPTLWQVVPAESWCILIFLHMASLPPNGDPKRTSPIV